MLGRRVLTAGVGGALFVAVLWQGGVWWAGLWVTLAGLGAFEYARMLRSAGYTLPWPLLVAGAAGLTGLAAAAGSHSPAFAAAWQGLALLLLGLPLLSGAYDFRTSAAGVLGLFYTGWLPAAVAALATHGRGALLGFWLAVWLTDIGAYFGGGAYGRHKLSPRLSPGKTWEGAATGLATAAVALWLGSPWLAGWGGFPQGWRAVVFALAVSVLGQAGDLVESALKRHAGVKDSGRLLPGHGGVLDRFDSALFAAPAALALLRLLAP